VCSFATTACTGEIESESGNDETTEDVAAQEQFLADVEPDRAGEFAAFDAGDDGLSPPDFSAPIPHAIPAGEYKNQLVSPRGRPITCPDPSMIDSPHGGYRYFLICTSDYDSNSFPIRKSNDLVHCHNVGYVFPSGHHPAWAMAPVAGGRYWAPEIYRIHGQWVVYFATKRNSDGSMVIGVATATALRDNWSTHVLHHSGEFNHLNDSHHQEVSGGVIDPSVMRATDGTLYLYYAKQSNQIWAGRLTPDGLTLASDIQFLFDVGADNAWEHDDQGHGCVEGPEPFMTGGKYYVLYSGASTWDGSYTVGVAVSDRPTGPFQKMSGPILHSGRGFIATGHSSHPVRGPNGEMYLLYHSLRHPSHVSNDRKLMLDRFNWQGMWPIVNDGAPSAQPEPLP